MPSWAYNRTRSQPIAPVAASRPRVADHGTGQQPLVAPASDTGRLVQFKPGREQPVDQSTSPAAGAVLTGIDQLPAYERLFGVENGKIELNEAVRSGAVGLIHADGSATVLISPDHTHLTEAFKGLLRQKGLRARDQVLTASSDCIFTLYNTSVAASERRQTYDDGANAAETSKVLVHILSKALDMGASDVDIHVFEQARPPHSQVFFRVHGAYLLQENLLTNALTANSICRAAYTGVFADSASRSSNNFKTTEGLYATLQIPVAKNMRLRMQTMPHVLGYGANFRILSYDGLAEKYRNLVAMGFSPDQQRAIVESFGTDRGGLILFIAGTGEGKTTTLMTAIPMDPKIKRRKWVSIEDPVEIINPLLFQVPVKRETGKKSDDNEHVAAMANSLRFDPDAINAGEIRDAITASMAEKAAMTGHVTAATLHGNDPFTAFNRLIDLGARKINLLDGVARLFCHQKLVQTLCPHCSSLAVESKKREHVLFLKELQATYNVDVSSVRVKGDGCEQCYPAGHPLAGIKGRTVVAEVVRFNRAIIEALRDNEDTEPARVVWRRQRVADYREEGTLGKTIGEHALYKLLKGLIGPDEYLGIADSFDTHSPMPINTRKGAA